MKEVMMCAQKLAEAILNSDVYQHMHTLEEQVTQDEDATKAIAAYMEKRTAVEQAMRKPDIDPTQLAEAAQELGKRIIRHIRDRADEKMRETGLNFSVIATPAEGLSGRFVRLDQERFGVIPGVTDREYYTNSFHIPVYFPISAYDKIRLEAPYHAMTNGGHITYVEVDGDPSRNIDAFEDIIRAMKEMGVGYGSINHPVDRDPVCGYTGIIGDVCPRCGRHDGEGVDIEVLRKIKGYIRDVRSEEERLEAEDKMPNMVI